MDDNIIYELALRQLMRLPISHYDSLVFYYYLLNLVCCGYVHLVMQRPSVILLKKI
jgi:hypothetical protein